MRKKRRLSQQDLRAMGASPGRLATRYTPDGGRAEVRQLTSEGAGKPPLFKAQRLTDNTKDVRVTNTSEGEIHGR